MIKIDFTPEVFPEAVAFLGGADGAGGSAGLGEGTPSY